MVVGMVVGMVGRHGSRHGSITLGFQDITHAVSAAHVRGGAARMPAGTEAASPPASAPAASASPGADWPETQSPGPLLSHEQLRRLHFDAERRLIEQALAHRFIRVGPQRGATRPEMIRSSEITGGFELRATCRARAPFDRNRVIGAPRHHSSEGGEIRLSSPYASLETYATEY